MIGARSNATVEYIPLSDPDLDLQSATFDFARYMQTLDRQHIPHKLGSTPTVFTLRRLSRLRFIAIAGLPKHEQPNATVAYGVAGVSNYILPNGNTLVPEFEGAGVDQRLSNATLDAMHSPSLFAELLQVIVVLTELDPLVGGRSKSSPG